MRANEPQPQRQTQSESQSELQPRPFTPPAHLKSTCMALTQGHLGLWQHVCLPWPTQKHERTRLNAVECQLFGFFRFWAFGQDIHQAENAGRVP